MTSPPTLPPLPEPTTYALVQGVAMQGVEYRNLSDSWEPHTARFSENQLRARDRQIVELCAQAVIEAGPKEGPLRLVSEGFAAAIRALLNEGEK